MTLSGSCGVVLLLTASFIAVGVRANQDTVRHDSNDVVRHDGDVMLAALFEINEGNGDGTCGEFDVTEVRSVFALQWFIDRLNIQNYIPGVTIGLETWRTCYSYARAVDAAVHLKDFYITNSTAVAPLFGVIGPSTTSNAIPVSLLYSSLPQGDRIPQISGSATGRQLGNKTTHPNFFRVIPPDGAQIEVILKLLLKLGWNYIAVVYTDEDYGRTAAAALLQQAKRHDICVPLHASLPKDARTTAFSQTMRDIGNGVSGTGVGISSLIRGVVYFGTRKEAQEFVSRLNEKATFVKVIFSEALGLSSDALEDRGKAILVAKGALTITPRHKEVEEFRQAWNNLWNSCVNPPQEVLNNTWLTGLRDEYSSKCNTLQLENSELLLLPWYHIQAAAMFASAMKFLHLDACGNVSVACHEFLLRARDYRNITGILASRAWNLESEFGSISSSFSGLQDVRFDSNGEVVTGSGRAPPPYEVYNFRSCHSNSQQFCFVRVGDYAAGELTFNNQMMQGSPSGAMLLNKAQCDQGMDCLECIPTKLSDAALVIPGDFYFVAIVPVHSRDPVDAFECGSPRPSLGADFVQAIQFALDKVNEAGGRFEKEMPGKKLGAVVFDSCYSRLVTNYKLMQLHKGLVLTLTGTLNETYVKDELLKRIAGYIGGFFSVVSMGMSSVLTQLDRKAYVHFSPTSVATDLSDRAQHPHFLRLTVPSSSEILALLDMLKVLSAFYVQIIYYPDDTWSADLTKGLEEKAPEYGVCIANKIRTSLKGDLSEYAHILTEMRGSARVVVVILQYEQTLELMNYLIGDETRLQEEDNFVFLGTEAWARRLQVIKGKQRLAGSITVAEEIAVDPQFTEYFKHVDPLHTTNFWLRDYWETKKDCYLDLSFKRKGRTGKCEVDFREDYSQDPWVSYYIQAVYAFASGVGRALRQTCPTDKDLICSSLTSDVLVNYMKQVKLDLFSEGKEEKVFDDNGDGENGYKYMQAYWDPSANTMKYRQIGTWTAGGRLSLSTSVADLYTKLPADVTPKNYNSSCSSSVDCDRCPTLTKPPESDQSIQLPLTHVVPVIALLAVLLVVCFVIIVCLVQRRRNDTRSNSSSDGAISFTNPDSSNSTISTMNNQPVQELGTLKRQQSHDSDLKSPTTRQLYQDGSPASSVALPLPHHLSSGSVRSSDYAVPGTPQMLARNPIPCSSSGPNKKDYLTAVDSQAKGDNFV